MLYIVHFTAFCLGGGGVFSGHSVYCFSVVETLALQREHIVSSPASAALNYYGKTGYRSLARVVRSTSCLILSTYCQQ